MRHLKKPNKSTRLLSFLLGNLMTLIICIISYLSVTIYTSIWLFTGDGVMNMLELLAASSLALSAILVAIHTTLKTQGLRRIVTNSLLLKIKVDDKLEFEARIIYDKISNSYTTYYIDHVKKFDVSRFFVKIEIERGTDEHVYYIPKILITDFQELKNRLVVSKI